MKGLTTMLRSTKPQKQFFAVEWYHLILPIYWCSFKHLWTSPLFMCSFLILWIL